MIVFFSYFLSKLFFLIMSILGLSLLIVIHELGHFLFGKLFNVSTTSFSIGFGPVIMSKKIGETDFKLSALPLGGYVELTQAEDQSISRENGTVYFETIHWWKKLLIMLGGIIFNLASAYLILIALTMVQDHSIIYKEHASSKIKSVSLDSEAFYKGLNANFTLEKIGERTITQTASLFDQLEQLTLSDLPLIAVFTNGTAQKTELILEPIDLKDPSPQKKAFLILEKLSETGITFTAQGPTTLFSSIKFGIKQTNKFIKGTFLGLKAALTGSSNASLSGPVMIIAMSSKIIAKGFNQFLLFLALISINLALINLLPLPILDGGQILFLIIELILQRPLNTKIREYISLGCWIMFMALFAYLSCKDILKLIF